MAIKQLQLRGISRTPSDRATADGGCAESLNVHLDQGETAPTLPPDDISDDIYGSATLKFPIVYIHKMLGKIAYIGFGGNSFKAYVSGVQDDMQNIAVEEGEAVNYVTSVGNTLIAYTKTKAYYFLYKGNSYKFLGNEIPRPQIEFITLPLFMRSDNAGEARRLPDVFYDAEATYETWNEAKSESSDNHAAFLEAMQNAWEATELAIDRNRKGGYFCAPVFLRYALRLYDQKYIHHSVPILCGSDEAENWIKMGYVLVHEGGSGTDHQYHKLLLFLPCRYKIGIKMAPEQSFSDWSDIINSIEIFISTPIQAPNLYAEFDNMSSGGMITFSGMTDDSKATTIEREVLDKRNFYLVKQFSLTSDDDMGELTGGKFFLNNSTEIGRSDQLVLRDELVDGYRTSNTYIPVAGASNYNSRVLLAGVTERLTHGELFLNGVSQSFGSSTQSSDKSQFIFVFNILDTIGGKEYKVISRGYNSNLGDYSQEPGFISGDGTEDGRIVRLPGETYSERYYYECKPYSWIAYPDTRCNSVDVYWFNNDICEKKKTIAMKSHPGLMNCAYAFLGLGVSLKDYLDVLQTPMRYSERMFNENANISSGNKLFLSEFENPFLFPAGNIITFPDKVVGAAVTSAPLSEGQVGDFDLYVFTEGGIRVLSVNSEGTFSGNNVLPTNVSRHVALPGTITPIEQAVIFTTEKGVMLLSGSQITELSRFMNGKPYAFEEDIETVLGRSPWSGVIPATLTEETLMAFMRNAKAAYDSNGARLIFFNPEKMYQYVYMMETQTWHKILTGVTSPKILNSYPDCLVSFATAVGPKVLNFSTVLDDIELISDTENSVKGIIVTRPFDLGEPDIRKTITNVRIRGRFNRNDVQYILLGSFDGIHWQRLRSLRGGSYKLFRMILLCNLAPTERITWVDVEYESRFTNRLR